jgi:hypothetical protein
MTTKMLIEFPDGKKLYFGGAVGPDFGEVGAADRVVKASSEVFESALGTIGTIVAVLQKSVGELPKRPSSVEIEFNAKLSGDCNLWIVSGEGEAEFKVKLAWEKTP